MSKRIGIYFFMSAAIVVAFGCFHAFTGEDKNGDLVVYCTIAAIMASAGLLFFYFKSKIKPMFSDSFEGKEEKFLKEQVRSGETGVDPNLQMLLEMMVKQNRTLRQIMYGVISLVIVFVILPAPRSC